VTPRATLATALRVLLQLRRDPRTIVLIVGVPCLLVTLLRYLFEAQPHVFDRIGGTMLGLLPFITMFIVTSITMLRERVTGTLERLMTLPLAKLDLLLGYALAFALLAVLQSTAVSLLAFGLLDVHVQGSHLAVIALAVGNATLGMALGLLASAFARTEFQAVQFMPAVVLPQVLLSGLFVPRDQMAHWLEVISDVFPLTYAYDALSRVTEGRGLGGTFALDLAVTIGSTLLALALGAATLRRRTP
jgi:ABC-2 type transport system permease protein